MRTISFFCGYCLLAIVSARGIIPDVGLYADVETRGSDHHDGNILWVEADQMYYWYAMRYTECAIGVSPSPLHNLQFKIMDWVTDLPKPKICGFDCVSIFWSTKHMIPEERCGFLVAKEGQMPYVWMSPDLKMWKRVDKVIPNYAGVQGSAFASLTGEEPENKVPSAPIGKAGGNNTHTSSHFTLDVDGQQVGMVAGSSLVAVAPEPGVNQPEANHDNTDLEAGIRDIINQQEGIDGACAPSETHQKRKRHADISDYVIFRPTTIYNPKTKKYVMWVNAIPKGKYDSVNVAYVYGTFAVFESDKPEGPFHLVNFEESPGFIPHQDPRTRGTADFGLMVHEGKAYNAYGSWGNGAVREWWMYPFVGLVNVLNLIPNLLWFLFGSLCPSCAAFTIPLPLEYEVKSLASGHTISIQELNDDFTGFKPGSAAVDITPSYREAPSLYSRFDVPTQTTFFYLQSGHLCCFCKEGSDINVWIATDPMGPWHDTTHNINPRQEHKPWSVTIKSQSNCVNKVQGKDVGLDGEDEAFLWTGDLWHTAKSIYGENNKGRDWQVWKTLSFDSSCRSHNETLMRELGVSPEHGIPLPCPLAEAPNTTSGCCR